MEALRGKSSGERPRRPLAAWALVAPWRLLGVVRGMHGEAWQEHVLRVTL